MASGFELGFVGLGGVVAETRKFGDVAVQVGEAHGERIGVGVRFGEENAEVFGVGPG